MAAFSPAWPTTNLQNVTFDLVDHFLLLLWELEKGRRDWGAVWLARPLLVLTL